MPEYLVVGIFVVLGAVGMTCIVFDMVTNKQDKNDSEPPRII